MKKLNGILISATLIISLIICPVVQAEPKVDKVLFLFAHSLSGTYAWLGQQELWGTELAIEHINKMGGIKSLGGAKIELWDKVDLTSDPKIGAAALESALASAKQKGVRLSVIATMDISGMTGPCIPIAEKYGIPLLASVAKTDFSDMGAKFFFRVFPRNDKWSEAQAIFVKMLKQKYMPNFKKLAIAYEETAWPTDLAAQAKDWIFKKYKLPIELAAEVGYPKGMVDATPIVTKLKASGAEVVLLNGYADVLYVMRAAEAAQFTPIWVGGGGFFVQQEFLAEMGPKGVEGAVSAMSCNHRWSNPIADEVNAQFIKEHSKFLFIPEHAISGYSGAWIAKYGIELAKSTDPVKVKDALHKLKITLGPAKEEGKIKNGWIISPRALFDQGGDVPCRIEFEANGDNKFMGACLVQWQEVNGKMEPVTIIPEENTHYRLKFKK
jgi:branched-chain amino acid transport system substrate-binding protein